MQNWKQEQILVRNVIQANCCHKNLNRTMGLAISEKQVIFEVVCQNCGKLMLVSRIKAPNPTLLTVGQIYNVEFQKI